MCGYVAHSSQNVRVRKDTFLPGLLAQFMRAHDKHKRACVHPCAHAHAPQAVLHAHARTKLNTIYVSMSKHARTHTHSYTCAAVNAWADTHIARTIRVSPRLHMQQNSKHIQAYNRTHAIAHTYMSWCSRTHSAHCTMQALARTHMPCTRTHAGNGGHHPHFQACTCSFSDW
jgi:hypothetical protein